MKLKNLAIAIAISLITTGSGGCSSPQVITIPIGLERPTRPQLPPISVTEAEAIPYPTWRKIVERNRKLRQYAEQLEGILDATQPEQRHE